MDLPRSPQAARSCVNERQRVSRVRKRDLLLFAWASQPHCTRDHARLPKRFGPGRTHEATCPESLIWRVKHVHVMAVEINIEPVPQEAAASALCWLALKIGRMVSPPACGFCDDNHGCPPHILPFNIVKPGG